MLEIDYLKAPVFFFVYIPPIEKVKVSALAGIYLGYDVVHRYDYAGCGDERTSDKESDLTFDILDIDGGFVYGAGVAFPLGNDLLRFDFQFSLGFGRIPHANNQSDVDAENSGGRTRRLKNWRTGTSASYLVA